MAQPESRFGTLSRSRVWVPSSVVHRTFDAETVLLNLDTGRYHGLRGSAGRMFELLEATGSPEEAAARVAEECGEPVDRVIGDVVRLCESLLARGLLQVDEPSP